MNPTLSDKDILQSGHERDFKILYDRYWKELYQKAIARLGNSNDAKEVIQDIFVTVWNNRNSIVLEDTLQPYLFKALKFAIIKKIEREYRRGERSFPLDVADIEKVELTSEEILHYKQLEKIIADEVDKLPERMKQVYRLSRNEHLKNTEIAQQLNLSEQTVKNILSESLKRLRQKLSNYQFSFILL